MRLFHGAAAMAAASVLFGASALAEDDEGEDEGGQGEEVGRICFARSIDNFRTIKGEDNVILLEQGVNDWYYVELSGPCRYSRLRGAQSVAIRTRPSGGCLSAGDELIFSDSAFGGRGLDLTRCLVSDIYRWDEEDDEEIDED